MSRDWTPAEHYVVEQRHIKEGRGDIFDFLENLKFVYEDGREEALHSPEEMALRRQFPMLGKLLMDDFMALYEKLSGLPGGIEFLHKKDDELSKIIETKAADENSYLFKWFTGRLDERFYYSERNNELFLEAMISDAMALSREPFDAKRFDAALHCASLDVDMDENRDFFETHANKLIYITENKKDLLDFDFWVRYELLLGEKLSWDEYVAIDREFDGDPHEVAFDDNKTISGFKKALVEYRQGKDVMQTLDDSIRAAKDAQEGPKNDVYASDLERDER